MKQANSRVLRKLNNIQNPSAIHHEFLEPERQTPNYRLAMERWKCDAVYNSGKIERIQKEKAMADRDKIRITKLLWRQKIMQEARQQIRQLYD